MFKNVGKTQQKDQRKEILLQFNVDIGRKLEPCPAPGKTNGNVIETDCNCDEHNPIGKLTEQFADGINGSRKF